MEDKEYRLTLKVRDYECDLQGIVNNANYQHYLEHARHEYIQTQDIKSFSEMHEAGIDFVVARLEMAFKTPLVSKDEFEVSVVMKKEGIKWVFYQNVYRKKDQKLCIKAKVTSCCLVNGKLKDVSLEEMK